jgi:hypothetical protein
MQVTLRALAKGVATRLPVLSGLASRTTGGTDSGCYCKDLGTSSAFVIARKPA